ncbi:TPA: prepilin peptidase [Candidatus Galligastranaerophilus intestinigallinarum]|nr:prepilin peptidase [Candidatus Galligastranaerophilus intestinigallinarum]
MNDFSILLPFLIWIFLVGLCIGSFLNVVALRGLSGESIVFPSSKCPKCNNKLKWWMNIPLLSYLILRGKCHYCKTSISPQYPIVEFITGVFFLLIFIKFGFEISTLFYLTAFSILMVMSICDIKESVILDFHAYILIILGIILNSVLFGLNGFLFSIIGGVSGFILYELIARSGYLLANQRAFGEGDSLIAAGIGTFFGWQLMLISTILSVFVMAIFTYPYLLYKSYKEGKKKTVFALVSAVLLIAFAAIVSKTEFIKTFEISVAFLFIMVILTFLCAKFILDDMKKPAPNGEVSLCMLPFGPAMAISFVIIMFFQNELQTLIKSYFLG